MKKDHKGNWYKSPFQKTTRGSSRYGQKKQGMKKIENHGRGKTDRKPYFGVFHNNQKLPDSKLVKNQNQRQKTEKTERIDLKSPKPSAFSTRFNRISNLSSKRRRSANKRVSKDKLRIVKENCSTRRNAKKPILLVNLVLPDDSERKIPIYSGVDIALSVMKFCLGEGIEDVALIEVLKRRIKRDLKRMNRKKNAALNQLSRSKSFKGKSLKINELNRDNFKEMRKTSSPKGGATPVKNLKTEKSTLEYSKIKHKRMSDMTLKTTTRKISPAGSPSGRMKGLREMLSLKAKKSYHSVIQSPNDTSNNISRVAKKYLKGNYSLFESKKSKTEKKEKRGKKLAGIRKMSLNRIKDRFRSRMYGSRKNLDQNLISNGKLSASNKKSFSSISTNNIGISKKNKIGLFSKLKGKLKEQLHERKVSLTESKKSKNSRAATDMKTVKRDAMDYVEYESPITVSNDLRLEKLEFHAIEDDGTILPTAKKSPKESEAKTLECDLSQLRRRHDFKSSDLDTNNDKEKDQNNSMFYSHALTKQVNTHDLNEEDNLMNYTVSPSKQDSIEDKSLVNLTPLRNKNSIESNFNKKKASTDLSRDNEKSMRVEADILKIIFNLLDSDQDGFISPDNLNFDSIPTEMLEHLELILFEVYKRPKATSFVEFLKIVKVNSLGKKLQDVKIPLKNLGLYFQCDD